MNHTQYKFLYKWTYHNFHTEAKMQKLIKTGYSKPFTSLEVAVEDYVNTYLLTNSYY